MLQQLAQHAVWHHFDFLPTLHRRIFVRLQTPLPAKQHTNCPTQGRLHGSAEPSKGEKKKKIFLHLWSLLGNSHAPSS